MQVQVDDLIAPGGEFFRSMFPSVTTDTEMETKFSEYLLAASNKATSDGVTTGTVAFERAVKAYASYLASNEILNRLLTNPSSVDMQGQGQASFSTAQMRMWKSKVDNFMDEYRDAVLAGTSVGSITSDQTQPTTRLVHKVRW